LSQPNLTKVYCGGFSCSNPQASPWMCQACGSAGSLGIDSAGNIYAAALNTQQLLRFPAPIPDARDLNGKGYTADTTLLQMQENVGQSTGNFVSPYGMRDPGGSILVDYPSGEKQLLVLDQQRVLFWNNYDVLSSGSPATGALFQPNLYTQNHSKSGLAKVQRFMSFRVH